MVGSTKYKLPSHSFLKLLTSTNIVCTITIILSKNSKFSTYISFVFETVMSTDISSATSVANVS